MIGEFIPPEKLDDDIYYAIIKGMIFKLNGERIGRAQSDRWGLVPKSYNKKNVISFSGWYEDKLFKFKDTDFLLKYTGSDYLLRQWLIDPERGLRSKLSSRNMLCKNSMITIMLCLAFNVKLPYMYSQIVRTGSYDEYDVYIYIPYEGGIPYNGAECLKYLIPRDAINSYGEVCDCNYIGYTDKCYVFKAEKLRLRSSFLHSTTPLVRCGTEFSCLSMELIKRWDLSGIAQEHYEHGITDYYISLIEDILDPGENLLPIAHKSVVVYTNLSLDDLCAIELLSRDYENTYLVLVDPLISNGNEVMSDTIKSIGTLNDWINSLHNVKVLSADWYSWLKLDNCQAVLLTKATQLVSDLMNGVKYVAIYARIGDMDEFKRVPIVAGNDFNANSDLDAFNWLLENVKEEYCKGVICYIPSTLHKMTWSYKDGVFIPIDKIKEMTAEYRLKFYQEYLDKASSINDDLICPAILAARLAMMDGGFIQYN